MDEAEALRYWCHMCSQMVNPIMEMETIKCPICQSGFVEEMASATAPESDYNLDFRTHGVDSERALSLWAPILLGMMTNPHRRLRSRRNEFEDEDDDDNEIHNSSHDAETVLEREMESLMRRGRRRRSSAAIFQLLQEIRSGMPSESGNSENDLRDIDGDNNNSSGEPVILINPLNQTITIRGSYESNYDFQNHVPIGSLGDYFIGPGLDLLLQHLADNDPNRYGTLPAQKEAVEALPTLKIEEMLQCSICLEDFEIGAEAKEMPCKHKFHRGCIIPWLELHSSCPVCRYQLPSDESKVDSDGSRMNSNNNNAESNNGNLGGGISVDDRNENGRRRFSVPLPWPLSSLFSSSGPQSTTGNSSPSGSITSPRDED